MSKSGEEKAQIVYQEGDETEEGPVLPRPLIVIPAPTDEPTDEIVDISITSVRDLCEKVIYFIEGEVETVDGERVPVKIRVQDHTTFTPDGLTRSCPELFAHHFEATACEELAAALPPDATALPEGMETRLNELQELLDPSTGEGGR
jgi:hypothetical protein